MTPILSTTLLRTQSDARLAELAGAGGERAFEAIVERYRRPLRRYCARFVGESRAEDAVQDVFVKAWSALQSGPAVTDLRPWLYRIAHNTSLNALRKHGYDYVELQESIRSAHGEPEAEQERRAVVLSTLSGLAALPDAQREALLRTAVDGLSQDEVARELGLTEPAIRGLVYRAREALRAGATALTPPPVLNWLIGLGGSGGGSPRIAELVAAGGGAAGAGVLVKAGALVGAGVIATGAVTLEPVSPKRATPSAAADTPAQIRTSDANGSDGRGGSLKDESGDDRSGRRGGDDSGDDSRRRRGGDDRSGEDRSGEDRSGSSGSGSGSDDRSGGDDSMTRHSGSSGTDDSRSGSSGSDNSGSGTSGSGSGSSGSGSDDALVETPSTADDSISGSSGSGSGSSGSGSGDSGSGISGSGSDDSISDDH